MTSKDKSPLGQAWRAHAVGRDDSAIEEFEKLVNATPDDLDVLYGLGLAQRGAGKKEAARETFERVQKILGELQPETENEVNRVEMLSRMVKQQLEFLAKD